MDTHLRLFYIAMNFLTRIPLPIQGEVEQKEIGHSIAYYPLVGLVIGLLLYVLAQILYFMSADFSHEVLAAILLTVWVLVTGGLHLDGLADSADAWFGGQNDRDLSLDIMKDPNCGPMGVTLIVLTLLLKWTAISYLLKADQLAFLLVVPMLSRGVILSLFMTTIYVRDSGLGSAFIEFLPDESQLGGILIGCGIIYIIFGSFLSLLLAIVAVIGIRKLMMDRIGGMTGDTLGATVELVEAVALLALVL
jgi:adenosylcobinamide-GDP ribazoletransferase